jgi:hypothetical protein
MPLRDRPRLETSPSGPIPNLQAFPSVGMKEASPVFVPLLTRPGRIHTGAGRPRCSKKTGQNVTPSGLSASAPGRVDHGRRTRHEA